MPTARSPSAVRSRAASASNRAGHSGSYGTSTTSSQPSNRPAGGSTTTRPGETSTTKVSGTRWVPGNTRRSLAGLASTTSTGP